MYLVVQNPGVAPVEGYTLLGVSTTRNCGVAGTIGQFGSGAKHAINTLLRAGLKLLIYCGKTRLEFTTRDDMVNDGLVTKPIKRVVCKLGGTSSKTLDMGWCLDFGAIDWTDLSMALREFVANAIDRTVREKGDFIPGLLNEELRVAVVEDNAVRAREGFTRVYVEINDDVQRFYGELPRRFLHFSSRPQLVKESLLPKADRNLSGKRTAMIYKEGVLVREIAEDEETSVYDYNFHDGELKLDESRNSSEYEIKGAAARLFRKATPQQLVPVFKSLVAQEPSYEATFDSYYIAPSYSDPEPEQKQAWQQAWELAAGPNAVLCDASLGHTAEFVEEKGFRPKPTKAPSWISAAAARMDRETSRGLSTVSSDRPCRGEGGLQDCTAGASLTGLPVQSAQLRLRADQRPAVAICPGILDRNAPGDVDVRVSGLGAQEPCRRGGWRTQGRGTADRLLRRGLGDDRRRDGRGHPRGEASAERCRRRPRSVTGPCCRETARSFGREFRWSPLT